MDLVECEVSPGLRDQEATVRVVAYDGRKEFMPVDRRLLVREEGRDYLPITIIHLHEKDQAALVVLPVEADSGAHRIWVRLVALKNPVGASA